MKFGEVLELLQEGRKFRRAWWPQVGLFGQLELVHFDDHQGVPVMPMLMLRYPDGEGQAWRPFAGANWDLLADDWEEVQ